MALGLLSRETQTHTADSDTPLDISLFVFAVLLVMRQWQGLVLFLVNLSTSYTVKWRQLTIFTSKPLKLFNEHIETKMELNS